MRQSYLLSFLVLWVVACTADLEPIEVTRVVETAVPSTTVAISSPETITSATAVSILTITPTAPPLPTATFAALSFIPDDNDNGNGRSHTPPAVTRSEFISALQTNINARDFDALQAMMARRFVPGVYPISKMSALEPADMAAGLWTIIPYEAPNIVIDKDNILTQLAEPFAPQTLFGTDQVITTVVLSSGWGSAATMQALLYITVEDGAYVWAGMLVSDDNFAVLPELPLMTPPAGLIYHQDNDWWRINAGGEAESMQTYSNDMNLNLAGTVALYRQESDHQLMLVHLPEGISETVEFEGTLVKVADMPWLNEQTAVLLIGPHDPNYSEQYTGNLSLLNVLDGSLLTLPLLLEWYDNPSVTADGSILYDRGDKLYLWRDGAEQRIEFAHTISVAGEVQEIPFLQSPVMSPDGRYVAGVSWVTYGRYGWAYVLADLPNQITSFLSPFTHLPTDAAVSYGIHWSPDSQWLALDPPVLSWESNLPVISVANPEERFLLGVGTSHPFWLDSEQLIFRSVNSGQVRWRCLNLATGEQFWLDLPDGAEVVHYAPSH